MRALLEVKTVLQIQSKILYKPDLKLLWCFNVKNYKTWQFETKYSRKVSEKAITKRASF